MLRFICFERNFFVTLLILKLSIDNINALKLTYLRVPAYVLLGASAHLSCHWRLGPTELLYSVKWYKDGNEFFRHVPREAEPNKKFILAGVNVEYSDSFGSNVTLSPATLETAGRYRCEVSGEGPLFPTVTEYGDMEIIVLPDQGPIIKGLQVKYRVGDRILANCTSGKSRPVTNLTWYINDETVLPNIPLRPQTRSYGDGLEVTQLKLDFKVSENSFKAGRIKIKCLATLSSFYWKSSEEYALQEYSKLYQITQSNSFTSSKQSRDQIIFGGKVEILLFVHSILFIVI